MKRVLLDPADEMRRLRQVVAEQAITIQCLETELREKKTALAALVEPTE